MLRFDLHTFRSSATLQQRFAEFSEKVSIADSFTRSFFFPFRSSSDLCNLNQTPNVTDYNP